MLVFVTWWWAGAHLNKNFSLFFTQLGTGHTSHQIQSSLSRAVFRGPLDTRVPLHSPLYWWCYWLPSSPSVVDLLRGLVGTTSQRGSWVLRHEANKPSKFWHQPPLLS